jgi:hypothetical protein
MRIISLLAIISALMIVGCGDPAPAIKVDQQSITEAQFSRWQKTLAGLKSSSCKGACGKQQQLAKERTLAQLLPGLWALASSNKQHLKLSAADIKLRTEQIRPQLASKAGGVTAADIAWSARGDVALMMLMAKAQANTAAKRATLLKSLQQQWASDTECSELLAGLPGCPKS